jgi:hypothetical protein
MIDDRDVPASNDRLTDELKAAVLIALLGLVALVALGAVEALVGDQASIGLDSWACATSRKAVPCDFPGKSSAEPAETAPPAPTS